jgi:hypothetical protein
MLSFILSKMNMLLFATGIFVVAMMFLGFVSSIQLKEVVSNNLEINKTLIEQQLSDISSCSFESTSIPEKLTYGFGLTQIPYDLVFTEGSIGTKTILSMSIIEHNKENVIDARKVEMNSKVILVSPDFIQEDLVIDNTHVSGSEILLYPRSAFKGNLAPADSFVALKEVYLGQSILYIIPCSSQIKDIPSNCIQNILKLGCYYLKDRSGSPSDRDLVGDCFDVTREYGEGVEVKGMTWKNCKDMYGYSD